MDPVDYEDFLQTAISTGQVDRDPLLPLLQFPKDDLTVKILPRKTRTLHQNITATDGYVTNLLS